MLNQKDAVILMSELLKDIEYLFPESLELDRFRQMLPEQPFSEKAISFLNELSIRLRKDTGSDEFPEIVTFSFFCRQANLVELKRNQGLQTDLKKGRGIVFHITPSNMPLNFAYSWVSGILSGNLNVVRLPSKKFKQVELIVSAIRSLSEREEFREFSQRFVFIRYDKLNSATEYFSSICDARIIWGGDRSVDEIKRNRLPEKAIDITFADKYSFCVINADSFVREEFPERIVKSFYNDTFLFDQDACTSPHLIVWLGSDETTAKAKQVFWDALHEPVKEKYELQSRSAIDKLTAFYKLAIQNEEINKIEMPDNLIWRIELNELSDNLSDHRCNSGYFLEYNASCLSELSKVITEKPQTIASYGIQKEEWEQLGLQLKLDLTNRVRPIGKTSEFSLNWDGIDLINTLSVSII